MDTSVNIVRPSNSQPVRSVSHTQAFADNQLAREQRQNQTTPASVAGVNNVTGKLIVKRPGSEQTYATTTDSSGASPTPGKTMIAQRSHANQGKRELDVAESGQAPGTVRISSTAITPALPQPENAAGTPCKESPGNSAGGWGSDGGLFSQPPDPPKLDCSGAVGHWEIRYYWGNIATGVGGMNVPVEIKGHPSKQPVVIGNSLISHKEDGSQLEVIQIEPGATIIYSFFHYDPSNPCYSQLLTKKL